MPEIHEIEIPICLPVILFKISLTRVLMGMRYYDNGERFGNPRINLDYIQPSTDR